MTQFFKMRDTLDATAARWYLTGLHDVSGRRIDERLFTYGGYVDPQSGLALDIRPDYGRVELDFTFGPFDVPIVSTETGMVLSQICPHDIQRIPIRVEGAQREYEILNVLHALPCLDTERSRVMWWAEEDGRPEKTGKPRMITELRIDPASVGDHKSFRIRDWEVALICSDEIKTAFEGRDVTGVKFARLD